MIWRSRSLVGCGRACGSRRGSKPSPRRSELTGRSPGPEKVEQGERARLGKSCRPRVQPFLGVVREEVPVRALREIGSLDVGDKRRIGRD